MKKYFITLCAIFIAIPSTFAMSAQPGLLIDQAWIQEGPPNARVLAGFMHINNNSDQVITIVSAQSKQFKKIEFHRTVYADGMARMVKQKNLTIKPGETLKLEHGGFHLMLITPVNILKAGDKVNMSLTLSNQSVIPLTLEVRTPDQDQMQHHHHH